MAELGSCEASATREGGGEKEGERGEVDEKGEGACNDEELEQLLNFSLGEFGKHVPAATSGANSQPPPSSDSGRGSGCGSGRSKGEEGDGKGDSVTSTDPTMQEFEDVFSEEFVTQAQAKLDEAMEILSKEDPELWQQLKGFSDAASASLGSAGREGEGEGVEGEGEEGGKSVEDTLEETLRRLKESTEKIEAEGGGEGLADADLPAGLMKLMEEMKGAMGGEGEEGGWEDGEDGLVKMMDKMMGSLLFSRDVLYPFLSHTCKQYGEWLPANRERLSAEDYSRYCHQLEVMRTMCQEFERETGEGREGGEGGERGASGGGGDEGSKLKNERIFELMQQLQEYGQPPPEIMGEESMQLPSLLPGGPTPADCSIM